MTSSEPILLDTNVLVYAADVSSPFYEIARTLRDRGLKGEIILCVCPQVLNEFFAVVTNPRRVTHPVAPEDVEANTLSGLCMQRLERMPASGDELTEAGYRIRVLSLEERRVGKVLIQPPEPEADRLQDQAAGSSGKGAV